MRSIWIILSFLSTTALADTVTVFKDCKSCPEMVIIPAGNFMMGTPDTERDDPNASTNDKEKPQHTVQIPSFSLGKYEITQAEWVAVMGENPSENDGDKMPVDHVTWEMGQEFVKKLSTLTGKNYRIPSEAEWEYAARAGSTTQYYDNKDSSTLVDYAWYAANSQLQAHPVGEKKANQFGLHDMHGNVWEWTQDCWNPNYTNAPSNQIAWEEGNCASRVIRGGSWFNIPRNLRSAFRMRFGVLLKSPYFGLRVARSN